MRNESIHGILSIWAAKDIPARIGVTETAKIFGFAEHDIQILMAAHKLTPLGDPAPNAPKWFAAVEIIRLAGDQDWLNKATKDVSKYWRQKRERQGMPRRTVIHQRRDSTEKVSPDSSPKPSPSEQFAGNERAIAGGGSAQ